MSLCDVFCIYLNRKRKAQEEVEEEEQKKKSTEWNKNFEVYFLGHIDIVIVFSVKNIFVGRYCGLILCSMTI